MFNHSHAIVSRLTIHLPIIIRSLIAAFLQSHGLYCTTCIHPLCGYVTYTSKTNTIQMNIVHTFLNHIWRINQTLLVRNKHIPRVINTYLISNQIRFTSNVLVLYMSMLNNSPCWLIKPIMTIKHQHIMIQYGPSPINVHRPISVHRPCNMKLVRLPIMNSCCLVGKWVWCTPLGW